MSRIAPTAEKIMAVAATYKALRDELGVPELGVPGVVEAALLDASVRIAMATDTRDMGIIGGFTQSPAPEATNEELIDLAHRLDPRIGARVEAILASE